MLYVSFFVIFGSRCRLLPSEYNICIIVIVRAISSRTLYNGKSQTTLFIARGYHLCALSRVARALAVLNVNVCYVCNNVDGQRSAERPAQQNLFAAEKNTLCFGVHCAYAYNNTAVHTTHPRHATTKAPLDLQRAAVEALPSSIIWNQYLITFLGLFEHKWTAACVIQRWIR